MKCLASLFYDLKKHQSWPPPGSLCMIRVKALDNNAPHSDFSIDMSWDTLPSSHEFWVHQNRLVSSKTQMSDSLLFAQCSVCCRKHVVLRQTILLLLASRKTPAYYNFLTSSVNLDPVKASSIQQIGIACHIYNLKVGLKPVPNQSHLQWLILFCIKYNLPKPNYYWFCHGHTTKCLWRPKKWSLRMAW